MSGVTIAFESKAPHTTPWLSVELSEGEDGVDLFAALTQIGWRETIPRLAFREGIDEVILEPPKGSGLFGGWTPEEAKQRMPEVRRLLRRHGFDRVPWNRLELADLI